MMSCRHMTVFFYMVLAVSPACWPLICFSRMCNFTVPRQFFSLPAQNGKTCFKTLTVLWKVTLPPKVLSVRSKMSKVQCRTSGEVVDHLRNCKCSGQTGQSSEQPGLVEVIPACGRRLGLEGLWCSLPAQLFYGSVKQDINNKGVRGQPCIYWPKKSLYHRHFSL